MAKKDTSESSKQPGTPKVRKSRKASAVQAMEMAVSPESVSHTPTDEDIARVAYALWESRGRPMGSPEEDWYRARQELASSAKGNGAHA